MMAFQELIAEVMRLLKTHPEVTFERGDPDPKDGSHSTWQYQVTVEGPPMFGRAYPKARMMVRGWLGGQWSNWRREDGWLGNPGFDLADVLTTDWRITAPGTETP